METWSRFDAGELKEGWKTDRVAWAAAIEFNLRVFKRCVSRMRPRCKALGMAKAEVGKVEGDKKSR